MAFLHNSTVTKTTELRVYQEKQSVCFYFPNLFIFFVSFVHSQRVKEENGSALQFFKANKSRNRMNLSYGFPVYVSNHGRCNHAERGRGQANTPAVVTSHSLLCLTYTYILLIVSRYFYLPQNHVLISIWGVLQRF